MISQGWSWDDNLPQTKSQTHLATSFLWVGFLLAINKLRQGGRKFRSSIIRDWRREGRCRILRDRWNRPNHELMYQRNNWDPTSSLFVMWTCRQFRRITHRKPTLSCVIFESSFLLSASSRLNCPLSSAFTVARKSVSIKSSAMCNGEVVQASDWRLKTEDCVIRLRRYPVSYRMLRLLR